MASTGIILPFKPPAMPSRLKREAERQRRKHARESSDIEAAVKESKKEAERRAADAIRAKAQKEIADRDAARSKAQLRKAQRDAELTEARRREDEAKRHMEELRKEQEKQRRAEKKQLAESRRKARASKSKKHESDLRLRQLQTSVFIAEYSDGSSTKREIAERYGVSMRLVNARLSQLIEDRRLAEKCARELAEDKARREKCERRRAFTVKSIAKMEREIDTLKSFRGGRFDAEITKRVKVLKAKVRHAANRPLMWGLAPLEPKPEMWMHECYCEHIGVPVVAFPSPFPPKRERLPYIPIQYWRDRMWELHMMRRA